MAGETSIVENAEPDSAAATADDSKYDSDFQYLASKPEEVAGVVEKQDALTPEQVEAKRLADEKVVNDAKANEGKPAGAVSDAPKLSPELTELTERATKAELEVKRLTDEIGKLQSIQSAIDEITKNPMAFVHKHLPQVAETLNPERLILDKLKAEFPQLQFQPSEAYEPGTDSYRYRLRESELRDQIIQERNNMSARMATEREQTRVRLESSKAKVMKQYNLTEEQFKKDIVDWASSNPVDYEMIANVVYMQKNITESVNKGVKEALSKLGNEPPKGAADIAGDDKNTPEHLRDLNDAWGD